jgi:signal transduction histidine kinase
MIAFDDNVRDCLAQVGEALDMPLLAVDRLGAVHVLNRAARELMALPPGAARLEPGAGPWQREVLELVARLPLDGSAAEVYSDGRTRVAFEAHALSRGGTAWGGLVLVQPRAGEPADRPPTDEAAEFAHEVKNSLHSLLLNLYIVRRWAASQAVADPQILTRLEALSTEMHRLNALAETFLPAGASLPGGEVIWLSRLLDEVVAAVAESAADAGVQLSTRLPAHLPAIRGDGRLLREALATLLRDRVRQLAPGDETEIVAGAGEEYAFIMVRDGRAGAPATTRDAPRAGGRALGIVDWVVRRHGGVVESFEVASAGAALLVKLPIWAGRVDAPSTEPPDLTPAPTRER